ncbi:hypothetical protein DAPPUDRAFT_123798, partial [Daphnia pulex]
GLRAPWVNVAAGRRFPKFRVWSKRATLRRIKRRKVREWIRAYLRDRFRFRKGFRFDASVHSQRNLIDLSFQSINGWFEYDFFLRVGIPYFRTKSWSIKHEDAPESINALLTATSEPETCRVTGCVKIGTVGGGQTGKLTKQRWSDFIPPSGVGPWSLTVSLSDELGTLLPRAPDFHSRGRDYLASSFAVRQEIMDHLIDI